MRTHCSLRVTNERSLFQISADLKGTRHITRNQPRLPPFPTPTLVLPSVQIKQVQINYLYPTTAKLFGRVLCSACYLLESPLIVLKMQMMQSSVIIELQLPLVVTLSILTHGKYTVEHHNSLSYFFSHSSQECLYVFNQYGKLSEFSLETSGTKQHSRVTDESPLEVVTQSKYRI